MLVVSWAVGHPRGEETEAREGEFHGLRLGLLFALQEVGGGTLEERSFTARKRYHTKFSKYNFFLILFCKQSHNETDVKQY